MRGHADALHELVYTPIMRLPVALVLFWSLSSGCANGGADGGGDDTGGDDTSSTTMPVTTAPADESSEGTTGSAFECDANVEIAVADGVELGAQSVDAVRLEVGEDVQYTVTIVGDAAGTTQLDIVFPGLPVAGMQYTATALTDQFDVARVDLVPDMPADFQSGTVTYTMVGTADGDALALEFHLEYTRGIIEGCVQTELTIEAG